MNNGMDQTANALRVALQTMKERCLVLQQRLSSIENENQNLRERLEDSHKITAPVSFSGIAAENFQLRLQINELLPQKAQLSEHITMISNENRKLWSRLSKMAKEQEKMRNGIENDQMSTNDTVEYSRITAVGGTSQNLIRSKTFTQHSPNPNLRLKLISSESGEELKNNSLDEVSLDEKSGANVSGPELGFSYLNAETSPSSDNELDLNLEKKCIEGLKEMRRVAMKQQLELNSVLELLKSGLASKTCLECAQRSQKPEMADKSLETDDSLSEVKFESVDNQKLTSESNYNTSIENAHINIIEEKIKQDEADRICPMCGIIFNSSVSFEAFREHVELHFVEETSNSEASLERNFEFVSHAVGDF